MFLRELRARPTMTEGEYTYIGVDTHVLAGAESKANNDRGRVYLHRGGHTCSCGS